MELNHSKKHSQKDYAFKPYLPHWKINEKFPTYSFAKLFIEWGLRFAVVS